MRLGYLGVEWEKDMKAKTETFLVQAQAYIICGITRDGKITIFVLRREK
jgi:hypothetical protein